MAVSTTTWWDKDGNPNIGYIKDGKTFTDEATTQRVPVGATVQTAGGTYKMTGNGGVPTYATARNNYANAGNAAIAAYEAASKAQADRVNSATNAAIAELNRQKGIAEQNRVDADKAAREAYERAANPFGAMEEQRVRLGLDNSGYAESSKLRLASDYAGQLTANIRSMNEQLGMLDVQIAEAKASGKYELANMLEARAQNVMSQKMALEGNLLSADTSAIAQAESARQYDESMAENIRQHDVNVALQREQLDRAEAQAKEQNKYNLALMFLENGIDASFVAEQLGIPKEDVARLADTVNAQIYAKLASSKKSSGGSGGSGTSKPVLTFAQVNDAIKNGRITPSVMSAYEYYYGAAYAPEGNETDYISMAYNAQKASGLKMDDWIDENARIWGINNDEDIQALRMREAKSGETPNNGMTYGEVVEEINELKKNKDNYRDPNQAIEKAIDVVEGANLTQNQIDTIKTLYADFFGI